ncbi:MAG: PIN domain-containing protein [Burkholderiales bacterium]
MKLHYMLIDYENVHVKSLALLKSDQFRVRVFLGKNNTKIQSELAMAMQRFGDRAEYVMLESSGPNALDFHIAYYLGVLATADPSAIFHVISKDKGFDPLIDHLKTRTIQAARAASIEAMSCFASVVKVATAHELPISPTNGGKVALPMKLKDRPSGGKASPSLEEQIKAVIENLNNRKSSRPAKMMTLLNTIHATIGTERQIAEAEAVRDALVARKHVVVSELKVTYHFPTAD